MKAWYIKTDHTYHGESGWRVVFAPSSEEALELARAADIGVVDDEDEAQGGRCEAMEKYWKPGKQMMEWNNRNDRIALVRDLNWTCEEGMSPCSYKCRYCPAIYVCETLAFEAESLFPEDTWEERMKYMGIDL